MAVISREYSHERQAFAIHAYPVIPYVLKLMHAYATKGPSAA